MIIVKDYPLSSTVRRFTVPRGPWLAVGIGPDSEHGILRAGGQVLGPGSPALFDQDERQLDVEAVGFYPGVAQVVAVTCAAELAALLRPRAPYVAPQGATFTLNAAETSAPYVVPCHGRARARAVLYDANGSASQVVVAARRYLADGSYKDETLNTYTAAADLPVAGSVKSYEETERCDALVLSVTSNGANKTFAWYSACALDEGT
jgi:hypothetical protein